MYQVILIGIREDASRLEAVKNLARLFKTTIDQVEEVLAASRFVLKKGITEEVAAKYKVAIEAAGGICSIESEEVILQTLDVDISPSTTSQDTSTKWAENETQSRAGTEQAKTSIAERQIETEGSQTGRSSADELAMLGIGVAPEKHYGAIVFFSIVLIIVFLIVLNRSPQNKPQNNPDGFILSLVSANSTVLGTKDGEVSPSYQVSFSNGYMMSGIPGQAPVHSGQVLKGGSPNATCVSFSYKSVGDAQDFLCVAVRGFGAYDSVAVKDTALKIGDLFISHQVEAGSFGRGFTEIYRAQVR